MGIELPRFTPASKAEADADDPADGAADGEVVVRVVVWDTQQRRKLEGGEAPTEKELAAFLQRHPHCEIYCGQAGEAAERQAEGCRSPRLSAEV